MLRHNILLEHPRSVKYFLYIAGAGAFGAFLRWLQDQTAFNKLGLADPSFFHFLVPLFLLAVALTFLGFERQTEGERLRLPEELSEALGSDMRLLAILRWGFGGIICLGALVLFLTTETDPYPGMQRVLAALAFLSGLALPLQLALAEEGKGGRVWPCLLSMTPVLCFSVWLVLSYRENAINPVRWAFVLQIAAAIMGMLCFFRLAGFAFGKPDGKKALFDAMLCPVLLLMCLADSRYTGMQIVLLGMALMLMLYAWIMADNLRPVEGRRAAPKRDDGMAHLDIPIDKMREFNRLPTLAECRAAEEKRKQEEQELRDLGKGE